MVRWCVKGVVPFRSGESQEQGTGFWVCFLGNQKGTETHLGGFRFPCSTPRPWQEISGPKKGTQRLFGNQGCGITRGLSNHFCDTRESPLYMGGWSLGGPFCCITEVDSISHSPDENSDFLLNPKVKPRPPVAHSLLGLDWFGNLCRFLYRVKLQTPGNLQTGPKPQL